MKQIFKTHHDQLLLQKSFKLLLNFPRLQAKGLLFQNVNTGSCQGQESNLGPPEADSL